MTCGYGMQGHVMLTAQESYGTSYTSSLEAIPIVSEDITFTLETLQENNMYGRFSQSPTHEGAHLVEGSISVEAEPEAIGHIFRIFCGSETQETATTSGRQHSFKMATDDFDCRAAGTPFTFEISRDVGSAFIYSSLIGNTMDINIANGELMTVDLGVIGAGFSRKAASTPTYPAGETIFKWDQASASFAGAAINDIRELTVSCNKNLEARYTLTNTLMPYRIKRTDNETIEVSGTIEFASHSYMQAFEAQSENRFFVHFVSNSPNQLTLDFPSLKIKTFEPVMSGKETIEASFTADALYNTNSATAMEITLTNVRTANYFLNF